MEYRVHEPDVSMWVESEGAVRGPFAALRAQFPVDTRIDPEEILKSVKSAVSRRLPGLTRFKPHGHTCAIAGGGPSLRETYREFKGLIFAVNGAHDFLVERLVRPYACAAMDPGEHMAENITPSHGVFYYIASTCHPKVFEKLKGHRVICWHPSGTPLLDEYYRERSLFTVAGGSTIGVRAIDLCYVLGFRKFELHGLDSSFAETTHAYPEPLRHEVIESDGFRTSRAFIEQIADFYARLPKWNGVSIEMHGHGLLQSLWQEKGPD
jgi:Protein of unknown function DUF115